MHISISTAPKQLNGGWNNTRQKPFHGQRQPTLEILLAHLKSQSAFQYKIRGHIVSMS